MVLLHTSYCPAGSPGHVPVAIRDRKESTWKHTGQGLELARHFHHILSVKGDSRSVKIDDIIFLKGTSNLESKGEDKEWNEDLGPISQSFILSFLNMLFPFLSQGLDTCPSTCLRSFSHLNLTTPNDWLDSTECSATS